jgi:hypothetical protein
MLLQLPPIEVPYHQQQQIQPQLPSSPSISPKSEEVDSSSTKFLAGDWWQHEQLVAEAITK